MIKAGVLSLTSMICNISYRTKRFRLKVTNFKPLGGNFFLGTSAPKEYQCSRHFETKVANETTHSLKLADQKILSDGILIPFVTQNGILHFFSFGLDKMVISQKYQMIPPAIRRSRIRKSCRIEFLTPFCNQKRYFAFFSFWLDKMVMNQKQQMKLPTS